MACPAPTLFGVKPLQPQMTVQKQITAPLLCVLASADLRWLVWLFSVGFSCLCSLASRSASGEESNSVLLDGRRSTRIQRAKMRTRQNPDAKWRVLGSASAGAADKLASALIHPPHPVHTVYTGGARELTNITLRPLHRGSPLSRRRFGAPPSPINRGAAHKIELGRSLSVGDLRLVHKRVGPRAHDLHHELVLVRAPLDVEELVDGPVKDADVGPAHRNELVAVETAFLEGFRLCAEEIDALRELVVDERAAHQVQRVRHGAVEVLRGFEDHVHILDQADVADRDVADKVQARRVGRRVASIASPGATLCGGNGRGALAE